MTEKMTETRIYEAQFRDLDVEGLTMTGVAAPYNEQVVIGGLFTETLVPGCFAKSIREAARALPLMAMHEHRAIPIGKAVAWQDDDERLVGTWQFDTRAEAREFYRLVRDEFIGGLSVGFQPIQNRVSADGDLPHVDRIEARLFETSLAPIPAYAGAQVLATRTAGLPAVERPKTTPRLDEWRKWADSLRSGT
jgi:uncharacterized protein